MNKYLITLIIGVVVLVLFCLYIKKLDSNYPLRFYGVSHMENSLRNMSDVAVDKCVGLRISNTCIGVLKLKGAF